MQARQSPSRPDAPCADVACGHIGSRIRRWLAIVPFVLTLCACWGPPSVIDWKEDVELADGRVVTLTRHQEFKGPHELRDTPTDSGSWFELTHPDTGERVRWAAERIHVTRALMIKDQELYLLTRLTFGGWSRMNCPNPGFLLWAWRDGFWIQVPLEQIPQRRFISNMSYGARELRNSGMLKEHHFHLPSRVVKSAAWLMRSPEISFEGVEVQTFGKENCADGRGEIADYHVK